MSFFCDIFAKNRHKDTGNPHDFPCSAFFQKLHKIAKNTQKNR